MIKRTKIKGTPLDKLVITIGGRKNVYTIDRWSKDITPYILHAARMK